MTTRLKFHTDNQGRINSVELSDLPIAVKQGEQGWTVFSPQLKVLGYSRTSEEDALEDFDLALRIFFKVHFSKDTLDLALREFGWDKRVVPDNDGLFPSPVSTHKKRSLNFALAC